MQGFFLGDTNGGGCCQSAFPSSLYLQQESNLLACFPSDILTESQDKKEPELHLQLCFWSPGCLCKHLQPRAELKAGRGERPMNFLSVISGVSHTAAFLV